MISQNKNALIVFLKNPVAGKVKTRLAASIGDEKAVNIYLQLLEINRAIVRKVNADVYWYINETPDPTFSSRFFLPNDELRLQEGKNLGEKMSHAFESLFSENYQSIAIIGTDCPSLNESIIESAFEKLEDNDFCIGPAEDGGYYLLAMRTFEASLFSDMTWSIDSVRSETIERIAGLSKSYTLLETLSDVDNEDDARKAGLI